MFLEVVRSMKCDGGFRRTDGTDVVVAASRLLNLLASNGLRHILHSNAWRGNFVEEDDEDDDFGFFSYRNRPRRTGNHEPPKVPSEEGAKLMSSGDFGSNSYYVDELKKRKRSLATKVMWRELGVDVSGGPKRDVRAISQVSVSPPGSAGVMLMRAGNVGPDTGLCCGQNHPFRLPLLLGAVFRRREFLLLLCAGLQGPDV